MQNSYKEFNPQTKKILGAALSILLISEKLIEFHKESYFRKRIGPLYRKRIPFSFSRFEHLDCRDNVSQPYSCAMSSSFHVSGIPGRHQCKQSFTPGVPLML